MFGHWRVKSFYDFPGNFMVGKHQDLSIFFLDRKKTLGSAQISRSVGLVETQLFLHNDNQEDEF